MNCLECVWSLLSLQLQAILRGEQARAVKLTNKSFGSPFRLSASVRSEWVRTSELRRSLRTWFNQLLFCFSISFTLLHYNFVLRNLIFLVMAEHRFHIALTSSWEEQTNRISISDVEANPSSFLRWVERNEIIPHDCMKFRYALDVMSATSPLCASFFVKPSCENGFHFNYDPKFLFGNTFFPFEWSGEEILRVSMGPYMRTHSLLVFFLVSSAAQNWSRRVPDDTFIIEMCYVDWYEWCDGAHLAALLWYIIQSILFG